jgi:hypothetical protein
MIVDTQKKGDDSRRLASHFAKSTYLSHFRKSIYRVPTMTFDQRRDQ